MRYLVILVGAVCLALPTCAPAPQPEPEAAPAPVFDQAAEEAAIREEVEREVVAYNQHDATAMAALLMEDYENWAGTQKGSAANEKSNAEFFKGRGKNVQLEDEEIGIIFLTPKVAIYKSRDETTNRLDEEGKPLPPNKGLYAAVYVKKNGKWLQVASFSRPITEE
jgi:uncharacterized protein (TIGR02246 family)